MRLLTTVLLLLVAVPAAGQEREIRSANLPRELEWELLRMYQGGATRYDGETTIPRGEVVRGDIAVVDGPLRLAGRVDGDVAMVNGDVILEPGSTITGSLTVVGGEVRLGDQATVGGTITAYATSESARRYGDRDRERDRDRDRDRDEDDDSWDDWDEDWRWGRHEQRYRGFSRLTLRTGASYNRVEGLPLMFGPILQTAGANPLRLEALAIWRSEAGASLDTERMGYQVRAEQFLGGNRDVSLGASVYSVVDPMDRWQISDLEASLATAVFHQDYRDHYDRTGWSAFIRVQPVRPLEARVEYRQESFEALPAGDPWSLFDDAEPWRLQPLVAVGDLRTLGGSVELDLRDDDEDPYRGWFARVSVERPLGGDLTRPGLVFILPTGDAGDDPIPGIIPAAEVDTDFTTALIDLRRYSPIGYRSQLNFRAVAGGGLAETALPPQFQHALGGLGTLPGFETFHLDCGARAMIGRHDDDQYFPAYGCDRFALGQVEYRGSLSLDFGFGEPDYDDDDWWDDVEFDLSPTWVVFFDAARGWGYPQASCAPAGGGPICGQRDSGMLYDVGLGLLIDKLGIYAALPLNGDVEQEPRFFVRLGRRF